MNDPRTLSAARGAMLAGVLLMALGGDSVAATVLVRNETKVPLVIQAAGVVRGALRRDRPVLLNPNEISPAIVISGNKILTVYDAKAPNRVLYQGVIPTSGMDQQFSIVPGVVMPKVRIEKRQAFPEQ